jgi:arginine:agmatine antiporter
MAAGGTDMAEVSTDGGHARVGVLGAAALVAGGMVGSGVYLLPATMGALGSISILGWLAAMVAALAIGGVFIWLGPAVPQARGLPGYVRAGLGRFFGVQAAIAYWTLSWIGNVAISLAVAGAAGFLVPALAAPGARLAVTLGVLWFAVAASWVGPRMVTRIEGLTLAIGLAPLVLAATLGWFFFRPETFAASWNPQGLGLGQAVGASALTAFWAFLGVEAAAAAAGVVRDPARNVPKATMLGVLAVAVLYIAAFTVLMGLLPAATLAKSSAPYAEAARAALGLGLGGVIAVCALLRATGCVTGWTLIVSETSRSAADEGLFHAFFRTRPGERASPVNLLVAGALMSIVAVSTATPTVGQQFGTLASMSVLLALYTYVLASFSLIRIAGEFSPMRRAGATLTAAAAIAASLTLIASAKPVELGVALVPLAAAAALDLWLRRTPARFAEAAP